MTDVKNSRLYKTLKKAVRKEDHAELLRMLEVVFDGRQTFILSCSRLIEAFVWSHTPQGDAYWRTLSRSLREAGHDCW